MKKLLIVLDLVLAPVVGLAQEKPAQIDPNKTVTLTVGELQVILTKAEIDTKFAAVLAKINEQIKVEKK